MIILPVVLHSDCVWWREPRTEINRSGVDGARNSDNNQAGYKRTQFAGLDPSKVCSKTKALT